MLHRWGIRGHLLGAFFGISLFAVLAAGTALYSFLIVGRTLEDVGSAQIPQAIDALEISREAERMVNAAPAMLAASTASQVDQLRTSMETNAKRIDQRVERLKGTAVGSETLSTMDWNLQQLRANVVQLHDLIVQRLEIAEARQKLRDAFRKADSALARTLTDAVTSLDIKLEELRVAGAADQDVAAATRSRAALQTTSQTVSSLHGVFLEAQVSDSADQLSQLAISGQFSLGSLDSLTKGLEPSVADELQPLNAVLHAAIEGPASIFALRREEFDTTAKARDILIDNSWLSGELSGAADQLVQGAKATTAAAIARANAGQRLSTWIILAIVGLSLLCSVLIVWLYVGRRIIARLAALTICMESVAGGDLKVDLPESRGDDEIDRMTRALTVFRDTAVEIEERNLRDIAQTRQRLMDAIESISEGFCCFDANDRLVVANRRFRELIYPGDEGAIVEGMPFERLIRQAAEQGHVKGAEDRIEEWVAERLARHRQPGPPHVQQYSNGRWVMISERRTGDGGAVAVYSDITELKQREMDLAEKSRSMEKLSNQIAKYLSPQIYDSIFTGKREVKVDSRRRKLTIFFSDIAGFTETAEQLESEELTTLLNHYLTEMSKIAMQHGATIDKYVGDAIVIFFGDPESRGTGEDALACVHMAVEMREKMRELQKVWRDSGIAKPLQCRIGINTGFCTVGNFGSEDRMDYTIIGSGVNLASRLESATSPGEILISHETYSLVKDEILCERAGEIRMKGISHPVETYKVVDTYESLGRRREMISEEFPYFTLSIDLQKLSAADRQRAASALASALGRLN
jgi:adenylate cyclase